MLRNVKVLGLVLAAALTIGIQAAPAASAAKLTASAYPAHLHGTSIENQTGLTIPSLSMFIRCNQWTGTISAATESFELAPSGCTTPSGQILNATLNGCGFVFSVGNEIGADHTSGGVEVKCPTGKLIEIHQYENHVKETSLSPNCTFTVNQSSGQGLTYTSTTASGDILVEGVAEGLSVQTHGACTFGFTINAAMTYDANFTLQGIERTVHVG